MWFWQYGEDDPPKLLLPNELTASPLETVMVAVGADPLELLYQTCAVTR